VCCPDDAIATPSSHALLKARTVLSFCCQLTLVFLEKHAIKWVYWGQQLEFPLVL